ncbi:sugar nucleotide-binding protein [Polaribacter sp. Hel_I_88]|uniref:sugar nucleotide-binding protein n=1 Tax=Polaribacter sp. Hel_I_88 TaxID=1250006 RepID=UPI0018CC0C94|nr:sugar nucleotide-binding protein [Polaribacter sp. Hel_I_88]
MRVLVLGSTSWLGSLLLNQLNNSIDSITLASTVYKNKLDFDFDIKLYKASSFESYRKIVKDFQPEVIVNFLRGEDQNGYQIHQDVIKYSASVNAHYIYASSALALDGYSNIDLTESILANGVSEYGIFKTKCEKLLYESNIMWTILRFSSLQGFCNHKFTRNENLLSKLKNNETITVDTGVFQNRMIADKMISGVVKIIQQKVEGIIHFGTTDSSDEIDFLRKQANIFGYSNDLIKASNINRKVNLNCIPEKIIQLFGDEFSVSEQDTLNKLLEIKEFQKYKKNEF